MRKALAFLLGISFLLVPPISARAQTAAYAEIASVDAQGFPQVKALLDVYDEAGRLNPIRSSQTISSPAI